MHFDIYWLGFDSENFNLINKLVYLIQKAKIIKFAITFKFFLFFDNVICKPLRFVSIRFKDFVFTYILYKSMYIHTLDALKKSANQIKDNILLVIIV